MNLNETNLSLIRIPFELFDSTGAPITGASFSTPPASGEVQLSKAGGLYTNVTGSVVEIGSGSYYYQGVTADADTAPWVTLKVNKAGAQLFKYNEPIALATTSESIASAVMASILRDGGSNPDSTVLGHLRRMDALFFGEVTGLLGALVTAMQPGGVTAEFTATQDVSTGSRTEVDRTTSEIP